MSRRMMTMVVIMEAMMTIIVKEMMLTMTSSSNWRLFSVACFTPSTGPSQPFFWV